MMNVQKVVGTDSETAEWVEDVKEDTEGTAATPEEGLKDVISSCRAGCDLKWSGIVQNAARYTRCRWGTNCRQIYRY